ncbi:c-type cytochrome [Poseidonibacter sp.]|uniref:c-type cytochrome n=1 Tax=Poseidonibacter sp. TaxID=2321188 RepID=UPI00359E188E
MRIVLAVFLTLFFSINIFANDKKQILEKVDDSFITKFEYGEMLYNNPRGIGCNTCHGEKAEGKKIVTFKHKYKKKIYTCDLVVPSIKNVKYEEFFKKINSKKNEKRKFKDDEVCEKLVYKANIMPTYFLVKEEINAIYTYINTLDKKRPF